MLPSLPSLNSVISEYNMTQHDKLFVHTLKCRRKPLLLLLLLCISQHPQIRTRGFCWSDGSRCIWTAEMMLEFSSTVLCIHTYTHPFNGPLSGTTRVSLYQKGKTNVHFTEARDSEWQWNLLGRMQVCTSLQTDNHASTPPLSFLQAGCPSYRPNNNVKALKCYAYHPHNPILIYCKEPNVKNRKSYTYW